MIWKFSWKITEINNNEIFENEIHLVLALSGIKICYKTKRLKTTWTVEKQISKTG